MNISFYKHILELLLIEQFRKNNENNIVKKIKLNVY